MKNEKPSVLNYALIGIGIGIPVTLICMILIGGFNSVVAEFLTWTVASALFGVISLIFEKSELPLPAAMAIHCVGCFAIAIAACAVCGYADNFLSLVIGILPVFVVIYVVIYAVIVLTMKANEKKINKALEKE